MIRCFSCGWRRSGLRSGGARWARRQLGRYVLADEVRANRRRALGEIVQMTEAWLPTLISELGLGKKELDIARASYHAVRERQVAAMGEAAP